MAMQKETFDWHHTEQDLYHAYRHAPTHKPPNASMCFVSFGNSPP